MKSRETAVLMVKANINKIEPHPTPSMRNPLDAQMEIQSRLGSEFLFCTPRGKRINRNNLRQRVWNPALKRACVPPRDMKQMRHSFATNALMAGENPLWIAKVMGHRDTDMIIRVYGKYIEETSGNSQDGQHLPTLSLR
jgi:integrase